MAGRVVADLGQPGTGAEGTGGGASADAAKPGATSRALGGPGTRQKLRVRENSARRTANPYFPVPGGGEEQRGEFWREALSA